VVDIETDFNVVLLLMIKKLGLFPETDWSYTVHLSMVTMEIIAALSHESEMNGNLAVQVAILHDVIEDTNTTTYEELQFVI